MFTRHNPARSKASAPALLLLFVLTGCHHHAFPAFPLGTTEYAYVTDGTSNTVAVLNLAYLRRERVLQVGKDPTGITANPVRNEIYAVDTGSNSVTVIDATQNQVVLTIGVGRQPYSIEVSSDGTRGYVPNSGSNNISVLDLVRHRSLAVIAAGEGPGVAKITDDNRTLVVSNRSSDSVSIYSIQASAQQPLALRSTFTGCHGATDIALVPGDSPKAFIACSGGHQVMGVSLAVSATSWRGKRDPAMQADHLLTLLDVGQTPTHLAMKPDGGEVFSANFDSNSISEISTWTNEVIGTYVIGSKPSQAVVTGDGSGLWVTNFGADSATLYSIDDGKPVASVRTGSGPDALAFSEDDQQQLLLICGSRSGDIAVVRTQQKNGPELFTLLPAGMHPNAIALKSVRSK